MPPPLRSHPISKIDHTFMQRLSWITMGTLLGSGSPPLGSSCQKHGTLNPVFFMCWFSCLVRSSAFWQCQKPSFYRPICMIHLATSLHCLGGLVVGLLAVPGILTQADYSAWVRPRGRPPILLTMWLGPLFF